MSGWWPRCAQPAAVSVHLPGGALRAKPLAVSPSLRPLFRLNHLGPAGLQPPGTLLLTPGSLDVARTRQKKKAASRRGSCLQKDRAGLASGLPRVCGSRWLRSVPGACVLGEITEAEQSLASCHTGPAAPNFQLPRRDGEISISVFTHLGLQQLVSLSPIPRSRFPFLCCSFSSCFATSHARDC